MQFDSLGMLGALMVEHGFGFILTLGENLGRADSVLEQLEDSKDTSGLLQTKRPVGEVPIGM